MMTGFRDLWLEAEHTDADWELVNATQNTLKTHTRNVESERIDLADVLPRAGAELLGSRAWSRLSTKWNARYALAPIAP